MPEAGQAQPHGPLSAALERWLCRRGFYLPRIRRLCRWLIVFALGSLALGLLLLPWLAWPVWLGVGAALSAWNFFSLAQFVQDVFPQNGQNQGSQRKILLGQLFRSNLRLFISGILIYTSLVAGAANPFALLAGLSTTVIAAPALFLAGQQTPDKM